MPIQALKRHFLSVLHDQQWSNTFLANPIDGRIPGSFAYPGLFWRDPPVAYPAKRALERPTYGQALQMRCKGAPKAVRNYVEIVGLQKLLGHGLSASLVTRAVTIGAT